MLPVAVTINALPCALGLQHCPANVGGQDTSYRAPAISHSCCVNQARLENGLKKNMPLINTSHATSCTDTQMDQFHCTWVSARGFLHVGLPYRENNDTVFAKVALKSTMYTTTPMIETNKTLNATSNACTGSNVCCSKHAE